LASASQEPIVLATPIRITNALDSRIEAYRNIRERDLTGRQGRFVAEGEVVLRLMLRRSRFTLESVMLSVRRAEGSPDLVAAIPDTVPLLVADDAIIESIAGFPLHRGILAIGHKGDTNATHSLLTALPERALVLACIGIANHDNMGGLFRNAAAFGASAVLLDRTCCDPLYRKAIRVSVGASLVVPFAQDCSALELLRLLESAGFSSHAFSPSGAHGLAQTTRTPRMALVLGSEGPGLPDEVLSTMKTIAIPMAADFDSLNVATSSAIALHHFRD
jgi:tRNA G18 (ribose-2'-O)-methylase SpoU